jgi:hypothetical protein
MKKEILVIIMLFPFVLKSQINYSIPPINAYFTFYKNGKSFHILNDSIKTSLFKFNSKNYLIKFFVHDRIYKKCSCVFMGKQKSKKVSLLVNDIGSRQFKETEIIVKELVLKKPSCISFLPKNLLEPAPR